MIVLQDKVSNIFDTFFNNKTNYILVEFLFLWPNLL